MTSYERLTKVIVLTLLNWHFLQTRYLCCSTATASKYSREMSVSQDDEDKIVMSKKTS